MNRVLSHRTSLVAVAASVGLAVTVAGCSKPNLTDSVSACYRAIPVATEAVHDPKAHLIGVHRVPADDVSRHLPPPDQTVIEDDTQVCAVAFRGPFLPGQVERARSTEGGKYAVVLVTSRKLQLVASYVVPTLPRRFQGSHFS